MADIVNVKVADCLIAEAPLILATQGIGSCVAVCLYDKERKIGGLAHVMLSKTYNVSENGIPDNEYRAMDTAIPAMIREMEKHHSNIAQLNAKLVGGAHMFRVVGGNDADIGTRNVKMAEEMLTKFGITVEAEEIGGNVGRSLEFDLETGIVRVTTKM